MVIILLTIVIIVSYIGLIILTYKMLKSTAIAIYPVWTFEDSVVVFCFSLFTLITMLVILPYWINEKKE